ncbi:MAG: chorismate synthase [Nitrospirae bacterium]|nr:chorismate synthase [Nitrospirota bacterium]
MGHIKFLTAGESHGPALTGIIDGLPAGLAVSEADIDKELRRRQGGHGRGGRMKIESDHARILSGVRWGKTLGSPVSLLIENRDWKNWAQGMSSDALHEGSISAVTRPRPGHADLSGVLKYDHKDARNILERSSARETAMRVALGAVARKFLAEFGIGIGSYVVQIGKQKSGAGSGKLSPEQLIKLFAAAEKSPVRCPDAPASGKMVAAIDKAIKEGDSLGGVFEVFITGLPVGLGSHVQWDRKLDGRLAQAVMSIQAIKGVEIGLGFEIGERPGSEVMDEIHYRRSRKPEAGSRKMIKDSDKTGFYRKTNNAGGIEGGMSNGMPLIIRAVMKPIPTLRRPLMSVDLKTKRPFEAAYERSDTCAVPAAAVVAEAMSALVAADAFLEKFGGDSMKETGRNYSSYVKYLRDY